MFLRAALKDETEIALLREMGRVFHNVGALKENACASEREVNK